MGVKFLGSEEVGMLLFHGEHFSIFFDFCPCKATLFFLIEKIECFFIKKATFKNYYLIQALSMLTSII